MTSFLGQAFIFLCASVIAVPIARRIGLGSVLGYLIAGVIIGPYIFGFVGKNINDVMHFAEFGVVMMLFLIGLDLEPAKLWRLRGSILGLGGGQVLLTTMAISAIALFLGFDWRIALATGMILALSSTAIVLQTMVEKNLMKTEVGQSAFSVLLFQDIAVIPMLALLPLLAMTEVNAVGENSFGWQQGLIVLCVVVGIIVAGRFLVRPIFRIVANTRTKEMFTVTALLLVIGIAWLMEWVGVSAALGTFLAGVVLADSEYKHELEAEVEPFKGLLLGLFFMSVGASINFSVLVEQPTQIALMVAALILIKMLVLLVLGWIFRLQKASSVLLSFALAQSGEFCFVLFAFADQHNIIAPDISAPLVVVVALSMALTPLLILFNQYCVEPWLTRGMDKSQSADVIDDDTAPVILAGMGRFGQIVARLVQLQGFKVTVLEHNASQIELVRKFGNKAFYGDASRVDLLHSAGAASAQLLVVAVDDHGKAIEITENARSHFPNIRILARASGRGQAHELEKAGADIVVREMLHSALYLGEQALRSLGVRHYTAHRQVKAFHKHDEESMHALAKVWGDDKGYVLEAQKSIAMLTQVLLDDKHDKDQRGRHGWDQEIQHENNSHER